MFRLRAELTLTLTTPNADPNPDPNPNPNPNPSQVPPALRAHARCRGRQRLQPRRQRGLPHSPLRPVPPLDLSRISPVYLRCIYQVAFRKHRFALNLIGRSQSKVARYLPQISPRSPLYLPCISPASPLHLPCISPGGARAALRGEWHGPPAAPALRTHLRAQQVRARVRARVREP